MSVQRSMRNQVRLDTFLKRKQSQTAKSLLYVSNTVFVVDFLVDHMVSLCVQSVFPVRDYYRHGAPW